ncbi:glycosyl hydrolase family 18 protein [Paenibacillus thiaminolyticus]|uniref:chitinase n=1 Tax=Paenibacillus thiaminolyticus TaxID=49283 RepID=UPI00232C6D2E|nr:glycosyl hydrolase family 18 protein [Paenibacillus thiaminolyticus]WCF09588.1 glycosyl hydrolase family 18 protein [Paenibacillus thiaminolyticus]
MRAANRKALVCLFVIALVCSVFPASVFAASAWAPNTDYRVGDVVTYGGTDYKCIQPHTSLNGWEPPNAPALWMPQAGPGPEPEPEPDTEPPMAPANLAVTGFSSTAVSLSWSAASDNVGVTGYEVYRNGTLAGTTAFTSYTVTGLTPDTSYSFAVKAKDAAGNASASSAAVTVTTAPGGPDPNPAPGKLLIGYWHNFDNGSTALKLRDVSPQYDVVHVAFAETVGADHSTLSFTPYNATVAEFRSDVAYLHSQGKKVLISIGGQNGSVELHSNQDVQNFVNSLASIIQTYGFDGLDIDLEGGSVSLGAGDTDYRHPTTPKIVNLIAAVRQLSDRVGPGFMLTMAPETAYVQGGIVAYAGPWGAYLPVIHGLRDKLDFIHVQHYNAGGNEALDGRVYTQGTADFQVAMAEMLLQGFPIGRNPNNLFQPLREEQVAIGLPAVPSAAPSGGYTSGADIARALRYIVKGTSYGGTYTLQQSGGYPNFRGVMTWSVNWDATSGYAFANQVRSALGGLSSTAGLAAGPEQAVRILSAPPAVAEAPLPAVEAPPPAVGEASLPAVAEASLPTAAEAPPAADVALAAATAWATGVSYAVNDHVSYQGKIYRCRQPHTSLAGWEPPNVPALWSYVGEGEAPEDNEPPGAPADLRLIGKTAASVSLAWSPAADNIGVSGYEVYRDQTLAITTSGTSAIVTGLAPETAYSFTVKAKDAAGNVSPPSAALSVTTSADGGPAPLPGKVLVGYWHNFVNGAGFLPLRDVSTNFDVIHVAFAEPADNSGKIEFTPYQYTDAPFKENVAYLQSLGKKVTLSIGGQNGHVELTTPAARDRFVQSVIAIIEKYGFDGLDIDFEGQSLYLNQGDTDLERPTTPAVIHLIEALRAIHDHFGAEFLLTMAPETFFVQVGYTNYGAGQWGGDRRAGAYLPVIHALRDIIAWVQVQHYNSGPVTGLDNRFYSMGSADFHVAMADMLVTGFPLARDPNRLFPGLRPDQVVIGLPADSQAGNGYTSAAEVHKALDYLIKGRAFGGSYSLRNPSGYPELRGLMTWSINWDRFNRFGFSDPHRAYLDRLH